jgi:hypothetical protein
LYWPSLGTFWSQGLTTAILIQRIQVPIPVLLHPSRLLKCLAFEGHRQFVHFSLANLVFPFSAQPDSFNATTS